MQAVLKQQIRRVVYRNTGTERLHPEDVCAFVACVVLRDHVGGPTQTLTTSSSDSTP